jgi:hypothetical protein
MQSGLLETASAVLRVARPESQALSGAVMMPSWCAGLVGWLSKVYVLEGDGLTIFPGKTEDEASKMEVPIKPGMALPVHTGHHIVKNTGTIDCEMVFFELKPKPAPKRACTLPCTSAGLETLSLKGAHRFATQQFVCLASAWPQRRLQSALSNGRKQPHALLTNVRSLVASCEHRSEP